MTGDAPAAAGIEEPQRRALEAIAERRRSGALSLEELAAAVHRARRAASPDELEAVVAAMPPAGTGAAPRRRWLVSVLGGAQQRGRWRAPRSLCAVSLLGGAELDLGRACVAGDDVTITCVAVLGGLSVVAPPGVPVELSGFSLLGGRSDERQGAEPLPGAPVVHLRVVAVLGGASVGEPGPGGVAMEAADEGLVVRVGAMRGLALRNREIRVPYGAIRSARAGAGGSPPGTPFTTRQGERLALFSDPDRAVTLEVEPIRVGRRTVTEIAVEVDDPERWLAEIDRRRAR